MDDSLFSITCTTCQARLKVRSEAALGQILACPKCESMVQVLPPPGWQAEPKSDPRQGANAEESTAESSAAVTSIPPSLPKTSALPELSGEAAEPLLAGQPETAEADSRQSWGLGAAALSPTEVLWRKWLLLAAAPVAGLVIIVGGWAMLSSRANPVPPRKTLVEPPVEAATAPVPVNDQPEPIPVPLDRRWLPDDARMLLSLRMSELTDLDEFAGGVSLADTHWQASIGRVIQAFGLRPQTVCRLSWVSTDLADWLEHAVVVIELNEDQNANALRVLGEPVDFNLDGAPCRRAALASRTSLAAPVIPLRAGVTSGIL